MDVNAHAMIAQKQTSLADRIFAVSLSAVIGLIILVGTLSDILVDFLPSSAVAINPLNTSARLALLRADVKEKTDPAKLPKLEKIARAGIVADPYDARFYSYLGVILESEGKPEEARILYQHSLKLLPTEIQSLARLFSYNANTGNYKRAIELADIFIRRWVDFRQLITPSLPILMKDKEAYNEALVRFPSQIDGTKTLIDALLKDKSSYDLAYRVVLDWKARGVPRLQGTINQVVNKIFSGGQYRKAYRLFLLTLGEEAKSASGYVYNSKFSLPPSGSVFDWSMARQPGLDMRIITVAPKLTSGTSLNNRALEIRFRDSPVRLKPAGQFLNLPPSTFTFKVIYSTSNYKGPNPVDVSVICTNGNELDRLSLKPSESRVTELVGRFSVPAEDCEVQAIRFANGNFVESWKNKFSGSVYLHQISIALGSG